MSEVVARVLTKGWMVGGGQGLDLKMVTDHDWSSETRLQGCACSLVFFCFFFMVEILLLMIMIMIIYWVETAQLIIDPGNYKQKKTFNTYMHT